MKNTLKLMQYLKPYMKYAVLAPLFKILQVSTELYLPLLLRQIVNNGIINKNIDNIIHFGIIMIGYALMSSVFSIISSIFTANATGGFVTDLRSDLFRNVLGLSAGDFDEIESGTIMTNLTNDVQNVKDILATFLKQLINSPLKFFGSLFLAISISPQLSIVIFVMIPLIIIVIYLVVKITYPMYETVQSKIDNINSMAKENFSGIRIVKAFVRSKYESSKFNDISVQYNKYMKKTAMVNNLMGPTMRLILNFGTISVLWIGGNMFIKDQIDIGGILAFLNYLTTIRMSLTTSSNIFRRIPRGEASAARIVRILDRNPLVKEISSPYKDGEIQGKIQFENVTFSYNNNSENPELKNISFTVEPGETLGILGSTGSGKSSLIKLIPRFYDPISGSVKIDDIDVKEYSLNFLRNNVSPVMQNPVLFSGTIEYNIRFGKEDAEITEIIKAAKIACIDTFIDTLDENYSHLSNRNGTNFSGGQKQRLAIARAVVSDAPILILDDSTSSVDIETEYRIQQNLKSSPKRRTVILVAQKISTVINADKIIILENGEIEGIGTHEELLKSCDLYKEIYDSQLGGI